MKLIALSLLCFLIAGCVDNNKKCIELVGDNDYLERLFALDVYLDEFLDESYDICETQILAGYPVLLVMEETFVSCSNLCPDEFVHYFSSIRSASRAENSYCLSDENAFAGAHQDRMRRNILRLNSASADLRRCLSENPALQTAD